MLVYFFFYTLDWKVKINNMKSQKRFKRGFYFNFKTVSTHFHHLRKAYGGVHCHSYP